MYPCEPTIGRLARRPCPTRTHFPTHRPGYGLAAHQYTLPVRLAPSLRLPDNIAAVVVSPDRFDRPTVARTLSAEVLDSYAAHYGAQ